MTCNACGEKPKNTAKDFTKAVIEINNPETLVLLRKVVIPASMGTEEQVPPAIGKYHNVILYYEANKHTYLYSSDGIPTLLETDVPQEVLDKIDQLEDGLEQETTMREGMDEELQSSIDAVAQDLEDFKNSPDVVDVVATYADLQAYDTSDLGDKDVVRVLTDETHDNESSYYRWSTSTQTWTFIGATGPYYTKSEVDGLLDEKQDTLTAGSNITISGNAISATDTTYDVFTGTDGDIAGTSGLVPAPATADAGKFLNADGLWENVPAVVQATGTSTTDVMSQKAVTDAIEDSKGSVRIITEEDNNWNYDNHNTTDPDCVALWLLEPGIYVWGNTKKNISYPGLHILPAYTSLNVFSDLYVGDLFGGCVVLPSRTTSGGKRLFLFGRGEAVNSVGWTGAVVAINDSTLGTGVSYYMLDSGSLVDTLTSTEKHRPLSARQGAILGSRIMAASTTAPGTTTVGVLGGLLPVCGGGIVELYMCTQEGAPGSGTGYAWTKIA